MTLQRDWTCFSLPSSSDLSQMWETWNICLISSRVVLMYLPSCQTGNSTLFRVRSVTLAACYIGHWIKIFSRSSQSFCRRSSLLSWSLLTLLSVTANMTSCWLSLFFPPSQLIQLNTRWRDTRLHCWEVVCGTDHTPDTSAPVWSSLWTAQLSRSTALHFSRRHTGSLLTTVAVAGLGRRFGADNAAATAMAATQAAPGDSDSTLQRCKLTWKLNLLEMNESRPSSGAVSTNVGGVSDPKSA